LWEIQRKKKELKDRNYSKMEIRLGGDRKTYQGQIVVASYPFCEVDEIFFFS
jgi:hypothetical protein